MRRPAHRRKRADRVVGAAALVVAALVIGAVLAVTPATRTGPQVDLGVLADLTTRLGRGEHATYRAELEVRRTGTALGSSVGVTEIRRDGSELVATPDTLDAVIDGRAFSCVRTDDGTQCLEQSRDRPAVPTAALVAEAVASGRYRLVGRDGREIAGASTSCFDLVATDADILAAFGRSLRLCLDDAGIVRFSRIDRGLAVDERTAVVVDLDVDDSDIDAVFDAFDAPLDDTAGASSGP